MADIFLRTTRYGHDASALLRARISAAKAGDPLQPVTVVVPSNYVGVSARRLLAGGDLGPITERGTGLAGLTLLTVYRLAELLGAPSLAAAGRRPVSTPVLAAAVRRVLASDPGIFAAVREHPSSEEELVRVHRELSEVSADRLDAVASRGDPAGDVVRIHRAVARLLAREWYAEADLMAAATAALRAGSPVAADLGTVVVHLPQHLSPPAALLLRAVAERRPVEVIAGRTGDPHADEEVDETLRRLALEVPEEDFGPQTATRVLSVSDPEEEVRAAVDCLLDHAREGGVAFDRMALLYPSVEPYARITHEQLAAAGIPWNGRAVRPLADRLVGRWVLDLLALPESRFSRPAVMDLLGSAPVRDGPRRIPVGQWERISRAAGIVHGAEQWATKLTRHSADLRAKADREDHDEGRDWLARRLHQEADSAERLRQFTGALFAELDGTAGPTSWRALARWCQQMIVRHLGGEQAHTDWPEVEQQAADRVDEALDRLAALDAVEAAVGLSVFRRTLQLELDDDLGRVGEFGRGVLVGAVAAGLGLDLDVVVVLGLSEGVFPTQPREDSLLPDHVRAAAGGQLPLRRRRVGTEHRALLTALAAASSSRVLVHPRGDQRRTSELAPSRWLLDTCAAKEGARELPKGADWYTSVPSFAHRSERRTFPATRQQYGLRALAGTALQDHPLVLGDPRLARGLELLGKRRSEAFTRFDGNLSSVADRIPSATASERTLSASQLETWLRCPHAYFQQYMLRVEAVVSPDERMEIEAMDRGSLVHDTLETWLRQELEVGVPDPGQPWSAAARSRLQALAAQACTDAEARGITGHPLLWRRDRARLVLEFDRFLDADDERRAALNAEPLDAERSFGMGQHAEPVVIDLDDGRSMRLRGRIDRLDRAADGSVIVTDYKTGRSHKLSADAPLGDDGTKLQLVIYGLAVKAVEHDVPGVRTEYWFTSGKGGFERTGYVLNDEIVDELKRALRVVADGIDAGHFPMRPKEPGFRVFNDCPFCDPDDVGTTARYRDWERIRSTAELRGYLTYIEPDAAAALGTP